MSENRLSDQNKDPEVYPDSIYGDCLPEMQAVMEDILGQIREVREEMTRIRGEDPIDHCKARIKSEESMREKCVRKGLPQTPDSALRVLKDAIGVRVVCAFVSDVYSIRDYLVNLPDCELVEEKDYIRNPKENGYRSYHMILRTTDGRIPKGCEPATPDGQPARGYFVEVQLRTISMDTWAALEHHMKYKKKAPANERLIVAELKRCADELASTDVSMQTIRDMIHEL